VSENDVEYLETDEVECPSCDGTGEREPLFQCFTCAGTGVVEVCANCYDEGDGCSICNPASGPLSGEQTP
jgi:RecJ-like exonuclease